MFRFLCVTAMILVPAAVTYGEDPAIDLTGIDRSIRKEPVYKSTPHYALLVFGLGAEHRAWFVVDGDDVAYIDRNGNGELTDPDERIDLDRAATDKIRLASTSSVKAMHVFEIGNVAGSVLNFQLWVRNAEYNPSKDETLKEHPKIKAFQQDMLDRDWLNGSLYRVAADGMRAQIPLALTTKPDDAQVCHLLGPLTIDLKWADRQRLEPWPKKTVFDINIGSRNLPPRNWRHIGFDFAPLTTSEVPVDVHPVVTFEYPAAGPDGTPLYQTLVLDERCCGDTCLANLTLPKGITSGTAKVTVSYPDWLSGNVEPRQFFVPINEGASEFGESVYIMFHNPQIKLKDAANVLGNQNLDVVLREDALLIMNEGRPSIAIRLNRDPDAHQVAMDLAVGTNYSGSLQHCDARFEICRCDLDKAESIQLITQALQDLTQGFVYQTRDKHLLGPK